ncbi:MAG: VCBS repeat-containing protein [Candidatus Thiodubiliella endoseptemdiera]|uniref:VCBS repeat-containing protein n=1 Tax=Candidatus Thiodubiliella endoseptemdiera TaxID=2738886 RepID=A0A853F1I3_9GAMM|nr:VCBS repeat-containing protein [Candidatus Thiodubiliella endoseptemdiera]
MPGQTKYFISNTNGFFVNWYSDITGLESHGQALKASGNSGDDAVYVGQGTKVDATGLTSTGGNDSIYLTGTFNNYEQTLDGNTYTFKRTVTIGGTDYQEEVSFTASNGDRVYFANGFFKIDITGNDGLLNAGVFQKIKFADIDSSSITPTDPLTTQPAIDKGTASEVGATKVFISDNNGEHITPGVKGSVFKISGNSGNDTVYVAKGTKVDATGLTSTGGNDVVYLTGTFSEYTKQTVVDSTYTFERMVNIGGTDYQEEVSFAASNGDRVYFADGFVKIDITGDDGLLEAGAFKRIESTDIDNSESTPGLGVGLSITDDKSDTAKVGEVITYTFTFDEAVTDFDINDITVTGGTKGTFTSVNGSESVYTLELTPPANSKGIISLTVAVDAATSKVDTALKSAAASNNQSFDTQAPTPITTNPWTLSDTPAGQSAFKTGDVISLTLTMSETLKLNNTTGSKVVIAGKDFVLDKTASTTAGDKKLVFKYSVQAGDNIAATDFDIDNPTSDITLNNITDVAGNAPVFTADRVVLAKFEYIEKIGLANNPFEGIDVGDLSAPTLADIDGDGDLDLVVGEFYGTLKYYQNTGTTSSPAYEAKTGGNNPFNGIDVGGYSTPNLADIDGDGDLDLVVGENDGTLKYYQNTGTTSNPAYEAKTGDSNPFNSIDVGNAASPTLADIDGDGDLDLVVGENDGTLKYYQNTGTTSNPAYEAKTGDDNPFNGIDVGYSSSPTLADIDGDGDLDLVVGETYGTLKYYQNTGTTSNPAYEVKTGGDNPFNGIKMGYSSSPTLADIDGDGDLDLVAGKNDGTLKYYYNQQSFFVDGQAPTLTTQASVILEETSDLVLDFSENIKAGTGSILIKNIAM